MKKLGQSLLVSVMLVLSAGVSAGGDAAAGKSKAAACGACHGADGNSAAGSFPKLAGQNEKYLLKQMHDIKAGDVSKGGRSVPTMAGQLDNLSDQDMADIAAYFASQTITGGSTSKEYAELGEMVYRAGNKERGLAACSGCHSPRGQGNGPAGFPSLRGQHAEYIASQLKAFRTGAEQENAGRRNDGDTRIMRDIAFRMSDKEIEAVASYIAGLR